MILRGSYLISNGIVYLTIADKSYPRKLAFSYLDELSKEFERSYAGKSAIHFHSIPFQQVCEGQQASPDAHFLCPALLLFPASVPMSMDMPIPLVLRGGFQAGVTTLCVCQIRHVHSENEEALSGFTVSGPNGRAGE